MTDPPEREPPLNMFELEERARQRLPGMAWDYYSSGANDELTLRDNRAAFERIALEYRVLVDVSERDASTTVLGHPVSMPILVAPTAFHRMAHEDGEKGTARAAGAAGTVMIVSTLSNTAVEEVTAAASGPVWFQLYVYRDRGATEALVRRVEAAGCEALVLTVDAPLLGRRERDVRNRFRLPDGLGIENMAAIVQGGVEERSESTELHDSRPVDEGRRSGVNMLAEGKRELPAGQEDSGLAAYFASLLDPSLSWKDLEWLRSITELPIVVKGIIRADDARRAADHGAAAVVVSNHGARQLDTSRATVDALPRVAEAVAGRRVELMLDGGVRRGTDVLKALALGARAVLVGRPVLWGLAYDGEAGARLALELLRDELDLAMALAGCPSVDAITADLVGGR